MIPTRRRIPRTSALASTTFALLAATALAGPAPEGTPAAITTYDVATRDDLLFAHLLSPLMVGDVPDWPILSDLGEQIGDWVDQFVGEPQVANFITQAFPVEGQPALRPLDRVVEMRRGPGALQARRAHPQFVPDAGVRRPRFDRDHLVVTSGLLNLYAGRPEELKFIVGHELGHVLCGHLELKQKAFGLLAVVQAINVAVVPDKYQAVVPTLGLGRLYTWCRGSKDLGRSRRAALLRRAEGRLPGDHAAPARPQPGQPLIDPEEPEFDAEGVIRDFQQWPSALREVDPGPQALRAGPPVRPGEVGCAEGVGRHRHVSHDPRTPRRERPSAAS